MKKKKWLDAGNGRRGKDEKGKGNQTTQNKYIPFYLLFPHLYLPRLPSCSASTFDKKNKRKTGKGKEGTGMGNLDECLVRGKGEEGEEWEGEGKKSVWGSWVSLG